MAVEVTLPELGESVEGGTLVAWLVAVGDQVTQGQAIAEVSTDKVDTEIPSSAAGTVTRLVADLETEVLVGAVLLELDASGESTTMALAEAALAETAPAEAGAAQVSLPQHGLVAGHAGRGQQKIERTHTQPAQPGPRAGRVCRVSGPRGPGRSRRKWWHRA